MIRKIVNYTLNHSNEVELINLARRYQIHFTQEQARKMVKIMSKEIIDIASDEQMHRLLRKIEHDVNKDAAKKLRQLLASIK